MAGRTWGDITTAVSDQFEDSGLYVESFSCNKVTDTQYMVRIWFEDEAEFQGFFVDEPGE